MNQLTPPQTSILAVVTLQNLLLKTKPLKHLRPERGLPIFEQIWPILPILGHFRGQI